MSEKRKLTRRQFLTGMGVAGISVVACGGVSAWALREPSVQFAENNYGNATNTDARILVAYSSNYGSTGGVADAIGRAFNKSGSFSTVSLIDHIDNVSNYDAVVIGAPVISDEWKPEAMEFVKKHRDALSQIPVAYFLTCMTIALSPHEEDHIKVAQAIEHVCEAIPEVVPIEKGLFAGAMDYAKMSVAYGLMYRAFAEVDTSGDFRDWTAIQAWADALYPSLITA